MKFARIFKKAEAGGRYQHVVEETTMLLRDELADQRRQRMASERDRVCGGCRGLGYESFFMIAKCDRCNGSGKIWE